MSEAELKKAEKVFEETILREAQEEIKKLEELKKENEDISKTFSKIKQMIINSLNYTKKKQIIKKPEINEFVSGLCFSAGVLRQIGKWDTNSKEMDNERFLKLLLNGEMKEIKDFYEKSNYPKRNEMIKRIKGIMEAIEKHKKGLEQVKIAVNPCCRYEFDKTEIIEEVYVYTYIKDNWDEGKKEQEGSIALISNEVESEIILAEYDSKEGKITQDIRDILRKGLIEPFLFLAYKEEIKELISKDEKRVKEAKEDLKKLEEEIKDRIGADLILTYL